MFFIEKEHLEKIDKCKNDLQVVEFLNKLIKEKKIISMHLLSGLKIVAWRDKYLELKESDKYAFVYKSSPQNPYPQVWGMSSR